MNGQVTEAMSPDGKELFVVSFTSAVSQKQNQSPKDVESLSISLCCS